jgi:hypothetical protein
MPIRCFIGQPRRASVQQFLIRLRETYATVRAFSKILRTDDIESGFRQMKQLGFVEWCVEAVVVRFSGEFDQINVDLARRRLKLESDFSNSGVQVGIRLVVFN